MKITELYDLEKTFPEVKAYLLGFIYPWEALSGIAEMIDALGQTLSPLDYDHPKETVWISREATVYPSAYIGDHVIIGPSSEVRHCAFIRGNALISAHCVVGNSTELKNVILFEGVQVPHYNYVGDSILGYKAHMGAGSITSNVKGSHGNISIQNGEERIETGLRKIGAMLGDHAEIGCNAVLNPGTLIGRNTQVYPLSSVRGVIPANCIFKSQSSIVPKN